MGEISEREAVGGLAGGFIKVFEAVGIVAFTAAVGRRIAKGSGFWSRAWMGGMLLGTMAGIIAAVLGGEGVLIPLGGCGGSIVGATLVWLLWLFTKEAIDEVRRAERERESQAIEQAKERSERAKLETWEKALLQAGVSAHAVAEVKKLYPQFQRKYFEHFELDRQDGRSIPEAHERSLAAAKRRN